MATNKITLAQIDEKISSFTTNRKALQSLGHEILMMIFRHAAPVEVSPDCSGSGDCTRALKLLEQMPKSWAAQADNWLRQNTPIRVVVKNKKCEFDPAYKKLSKQDKLTWWKLEEANVTPFYELEEPEAKTTDLDFEALVKLIESTAKRIEKKVEEGHVKADDVLTALDVASRLKGFKVKRVKPAPANTDDSGEKAASAPANTNTGNVVEMPKENAA